MRTQSNNPAPRKSSTTVNGSATLTKSGGNSGVDPLASMMTRVKRSPSTQSGSSSRGEILTNGSSSSYNQESTSGIVKSGSGSLPPIHPGNGLNGGRSSGSPTATRRSSVAGKNLPAKRTVTDFGITVDEAALERFKAIKKNTSPFDANMFLPMLKPCPSNKTGKITLALDIDETMVHSSLKPREGTYVPDTVISITAGGQTGNIYVKYRPHLMTFLEAVKPLFEVVVFTASQSQYANQLMDTLDPKREFVTDRLFREHCTEVNGARVKDLTLLGRSLDRIVILDNSPVAYLFQQRNAIPILSWFDDPNDTELLKLIPFLQDLSMQNTVYPALDMYNAAATATSTTNTPTSGGLSP